jgi:hypothetical protein
LRQVTTFQNPCYVGGASQEQKRHIWQSNIDFIDFDRLYEFAGTDVGLLSRLDAVIGLLVEASSGDARPSAEIKPVGRNATLRDVDQAGHGDRVAHAAQLSSYPRQNSLALAMREIGQIERTLFTSD